MLNGSLRSLEADSSAADSYLFLSDLMKFIEEARIAKANHREIELISRGLKLASHAG